jgi:uncharacterized protein YdbL (DUF1318 family)
MTFSLSRSAFFTACALPVWGVVLSSCAPTVNLATPEPVKIDVNMTVNVKSPELPSPAVDAAKSDAAAAAQQRRNRMQEIQNLKNDLVIGENRNGYLEIRKTPDDTKYATYAKQVTDAENADRSALYEAKAKEKGVSSAFIEREAAEGWRDRAFPKEWIQSIEGTWQQK